MKRPRAFTLVALGVLAVWLVLYFAAVRPGFLRWGATDEEAARVLTGDERTPVSGYQCTRAVTVDAPPDKVWPWIVRLGVGQGGFYSYSWLENLVLAGIHNADTLDPSAPARASGDFVRSFQFGADRPGTNGWRFDVLAAGRAFFLDPGWGPFLLEPAGASQTRLLIRSRGNPASPVGKALSGLFFDPIHFTMEKRMMVEIKRLAEGRPETMRLLSIPAAFGFLLAAFIAAMVIVTSGDVPRVLTRGAALTRPRKKLWILLPLLWALAIAGLAQDLRAAMVGFTALSLIVAGFRALGRRGWAFVAGFWIYADLVLIYAHDAYLVFGLAFLAADLVFFQVRALRLKQERIAALAARP
jgi:hypothetical protein